MANVKDLYILSFTKCEDDHINSIPKRDLEKKTYTKLKHN